MAYNNIVLSGIIGSNPLGALAAFGLLRVCSEIPALADSRLYWTWDQDWVAVLSCHGGIGKDELIEMLVARQETRPINIFNCSDDIRVKSEEYREKLEEHAKKAKLHDRVDADYLAAFASEIVLDGSKHLVKPTSFYMVSGQQNFLDGIRKMSALMLLNTRRSFNEALFGPWKYEDKCHSLGLDPSTERLHALRHLAPTKEAPKCVLAAVWLAIEALPLFPTAAASGRLATTAFTKDKPTTLVWPIWKPPIGLDTLRTLLMTSDDESSLKKRGVVAIYRSVRSEFNQGYAILRPAIDSV